MTIFRIMDGNHVKHNGAWSYVAYESLTTIFTKYSGMVLPSESLMEWLVAHSVEAIFFTNITWLTTAQMINGKEFPCMCAMRSDFSIEIQDPHHALLFKLTWM